MTPERLEELQKYMESMSMGRKEESSEDRALPPLPPRRPVELGGTEEPTVVPTEVPTEEPTVVPTEVPTEEPTVVPTEEPTEVPTSEQSGPAATYAAKLKAQQEYALGMVEKKKQQQSDAASEEVKNLVADKAFMKSLRYHYKDFAGEDEGKQLEYESDVGYFNRYMSSQFRAYTGNEYETAMLLNYTKETDDKGRLAFGNVFSNIEQKAPSLINGQNMGEAMRNIGDSVYYGAYSPSTIASATVGFLIGGPSGSAAAGAVVKQGLISRIRGHLLSKAALGGSITGGLITGTGEATLQHSQRLSHVDPKNAEFDEERSPKSIPYDYEKIAIQTGAGVLTGYLDGIGGRLRAIQYRDSINNRLEDIIKTAENAKQDSMVEAVAGNPQTGRSAPHVLALAQILEEPMKKGVSPQKLMDTVSDSFIFDYNVSSADLGDAYRAINNPIVFQKMSELSVSLQRNLKESGNLDILGEAAVNTFAGYRPNRKGVTSITEVIADGFDAIDKILLGSQKSNRLKRAADFKNTLTNSESDLFLDTLQASMKKAGVSNKEFFAFMNAYTNGYISVGGRIAKGTVGDITKAQASQAGQYFVSLSNAAKTLTRDLSPLLDQDPVLKALVEKRYGRPDLTTSRMGSGLNFLRMLENTRIAAMTSQFITTSRNIKTGVHFVNSKLGVDLVDSIIYHADYAVRSHKKGRPASLGQRGVAVGKGISEVFTDALSSWDHMSSAWRSSRGRAVMEASLLGNPRALNTLLRYQADLTGEATSGVNKQLKNFSEFMNQFNMAADSFFRRGFYLHSLDKRFKTLMREHKLKTGKEYMDGKYKNVLDFVEGGNSVPSKLIAEAVNDALKDTMSYTPKGGVGKAFINLMETTKPISSVGVTPFSRFVVNVIRNTYEYTPFSPLTSAAHNLMNAEVKHLSATKKVLTGDDMREAWGKGVVGTAIIFSTDASLANRDEGQRWNEVRDLNPLSAFDKTPPKTEGAMVAEDYAGTDAEYPLGGYRAMVYLGRMILGKEENNPREIKRALEVLSGVPRRQVEQTGSFMTAVFDKFMSIKQDQDSNEDSTQSMMDRDYIAEFTADVTGAFLTFLRQAGDVRDALSFDSIPDTRTITDQEDSFLNTVGQRMFRSIPTEFGDFNLLDSFGGKPDEKNFAINFDPRFNTHKDVIDGVHYFPDVTAQRNRPLERMLKGIAYNRRSSQLEMALRALQLEEMDIFPRGRQTGRVYNMQKAFFADRTFNALTNIINTPEYKSRDNNGKREMIMENMEEYRKDAKERTELYIKLDVDKKFKEAYNTYINLPKDASKEDKLNAKYDYLYYRLFDITSDYAKEKWVGKSNKNTVGKVEAEFRKRHEMATAKYNEGKRLDNYDYLYLRGPTIAEQSSFGLAIDYNTMLEIDNKIIVNRAAAGRPD